MEEESAATSPVAPATLVQKKVKKVKRKKKKASVKASAQQSLPVSAEPVVANTEPVEAAPLETVPLEETLPTIVSSTETKDGDKKKEFKPPVPRKRPSKYDAIAPRYLEPRIKPRVQRRSSRDDDIIKNNMKIPDTGYAKTVYHCLESNQRPNSSQNGLDFEPWDQRHDLFLRAQAIVNTSPEQQDPIEPEIPILRNTRWRKGSDNAVFGAVAPYSRITYDQYKGNHAFSYGSTAILNEQASKKGLAGAPPPFNVYFKHAPDPNTDPSQLLLDIKRFDMQRKKQAKMAAEEHVFDKKSPRVRYVVHKSKSGLDSDSEMSVMATTPTSRKSSARLLTNKIVFVVPSEMENHEKRVTFEPTKEEEEEEEKDKQITPSLDTLPTHSRQLSHQDDAITRQVTFADHVMMVKDILIDAQVEKDEPEWIEHEQEFEHMMATTETRKRVTLSAQPEYILIDHEEEKKPSKPASNSNPDILRGIYTSLELRFVHDTTPSTPSLLGKDSPPTSQSQTHASMQVKSKQPCKKALVGTSIALDSFENDVDGEYLHSAFSVSDSSFSSLTARQSTPSIQKGQRAHPLFDSPHPPTSPSTWPKPSLFQDASMTRKSIRVVSAPELGREASMDSDSMASQQSLSIPSDVSKMSLCALKKILRPLSQYSRKARRRPIDNGDASTIHTTKPDMLYATYHHPLTKPNGKILEKKSCILIRPHTSTCDMQLLTNNTLYKPIYERLTRQQLKEQSALLISKPKDTPTKTIVSTMKPLKKSTKQSIALPSLLSSKLYAYMQESGLVPSPPQSDMLHPSPAAIPLSLSTSLTYSY